MKTTLRSTIGLLLMYLMLPNALIAQVNFDNDKYPFASDSLIYENYENGAWGVDNTQKYTLHPDRRPISVYFYDPNSSLPFRVLYLYNGANKLTGYDLSLNFGGTWMEFIHLRLTRDGNGNVTEVFTEQLDQPGGTFKNDSRTLISYDAQNREIMEIEQTWDDNVTPAVWANNSKSTFTYNANNKVDVQMDSSWVNNNLYSFNAKFVNEYTNGLLSIKYRKTSTDVIAGRTTYAYNASNVLLEEITENLDGANYTLYSKDSAIVDANNLITAQYSYNFDFNVNKSILNERMNASGSSVGIYNAMNILKSLKAFPNPTSGLTNIKLAKPADATVEVFNSIGENVLNLSLSAGQTGVDLSGLSNGIYMISVKSMGETYQSKVILNK